jgi:hypothetical protein
MQSDLRHFCSCLEMSLLLFFFLLFMGMAFWAYPFIVWLEVVIWVLAYENCIGTTFPRYTIV